MNDLVPLRSSSDDEWERAVLLSAQGDAPPLGARMRVALAMGLGSALVAASTSAGAKGAAAVGAAAGSATSGAAGAAATGVIASGVAASGVATGVAAGSTGAVVTTSLAAWAGIGVLAGVITSVGGHSISQSTHTERVTPSAVAPVSDAAKIKAAPRAARSAELLAPLPDLPAAPVASAPAEQLGTLPEPRVERSEGTARRAPVAASSSLLAEEVRSLDEVRAALDAGDGERALGALGRHSRRFPNGALRAESRVLRVKALLMSGERARAEREADSVVREAPGSRYAERVRALLGERRKP